MEEVAEVELGLPDLLLLAVELLPEDLGRRVLARLLVPEVQREDLESRQHRQHLLQVAEVEVDHALALLSLEDALEDRNATT